MKPKLLVAIVCGVACVVCLFVAYERYQTNADNVRAMEQLRGGMLFGSGELTAATPAATKYALLGAGISVAGAVLAVMLHLRDRQADAAADPRTEHTADEAGDHRGG